MARTKQRETYGNGSVSPVMIAKKDKRGLPVWRVCITVGVEEYTDKSGKRRITPTLTSNRRV